MKLRSTMIVVAAILLTVAPASSGFAAEPPWVEADDDVLTPLGVWADDLEGKTLYGQGGEEMGDIEEVLATPDGVVAGLAAEIEDGVFGFGEHTVILRFDQVQRRRDGIFTHLSRAQVEAQPRWED